MMRYVEADDFGKPSNAFLLCTFWYIDALAASAGAKKRSSCSTMCSPGAITSACCPRISIRHRRAVGQFPANLFAGRPDPVGHAAVAAAGRRAFGTPRSRLQSRRRSRSRAAPRRAASPSPCAISCSAGLDVVRLERTRWPPSPAANRAGGRRPAGSPTPPRSRRPKTTRRSITAYANSVLWPLFHFRLGLIEFRRAAITGLSSGQPQYAERAGQVLEPGDVIWVHDYHLIPFGRMLRQRGFRNRIGFFLHVPFPAPEVMQRAAAAPRADASTAAPTTWSASRPRTMSRDFRGYVAERDRRRRVEGGCVKLGGRAWRRRLSRSASTPRLSRASARAPRPRREQRLAGSLGGRALVIGVDRMDYCKGLPRNASRPSASCWRASGASSARSPSADRAALARGSRRVPQAAARARCRRRPHQRPLRRVRLDAGALSQRELRPPHAGGLLSRGPRRLGRRRCATA